MQSFAPFAFSLIRDKISDPSFLVSIYYSAKKKRLLIFNFSTASNFNHFLLRIFLRFFSNTPFFPEYSLYGNLRIGFFPDESSNRSSKPISNTVLQKIFSTKIFSGISKKIFQLVTSQFLFQIKAVSFFFNILK